MNSKPIETLTKWYRKTLTKWYRKLFPTINPAKLTLGRTEWDFANGQGIAGWCTYEEGNPFEATFVGQSVIKPIRGDCILSRMKSGKVGIFQIYWFMPLFVDNKWKARACFIGYKENYGIQKGDSHLPVRYKGNPSDACPLVAAAQTLDFPSLEKLAETMARMDNRGVGGPRPPLGKLPSVSAEPVDRVGEQGKV